MGDALCGPSNALQNFQKHASVDRTLQQDRLITRQSPAQGFRSQSPRDGILDPEFAAFEASIDGPAAPDFQHPAQFGAPAQLPAHHPGNADWASDFQNLQISGPSHPVSQSPGPSMAPVAHGGWQKEFLSHQPAPAHHVQAAHPTMNRGFQPAFAPNYPMHFSMNAMHTPLESRPEAQAPMERFDESAFEAAFEQARADMELQGAEHATQEELQQSFDEINESHATVREEIRIGSDNIPATDKQNEHERGHDADELARTAGQLLNSVSNNQSQKFQQSNFLALMRRIRDREVEVEGEEFRETAQSLHPGGRYYPGQPHSPDSAVPASSKEPRPHATSPSTSEEPHRT
ncbi:peroxin-20 Pex20-Penicillium chrysogenum [Penicillium alfredii]|uniref:Peroxin-20 Pex20-Penicillium chrysogenum n=1 Tax=Penicillium alfredii TaxID=1506179 RepID=A0A9W9EGS6_9EURO|nr:peroxin-20 Pex20-Penicillium chrysogenum [Penicillium alfredii]KAJ5081442.1 peroxin-20 Pex20-Penicillium chrysogenum [Penicillium alfredii]